jgi:GTPase SAR1 family protein
VKVSAPVKIKLMIIGSEKVGKSLLIKNLFQDAQDSESPIK